MPRRLFLAALLLGAAVSWVRADDDGVVTFGGYLKDILEDSHSVLGDEPYYSNLTRLSMTADVDDGPFVAYADFREEYRFGTYYNTADYKLFGLGTSPYWLNLQGIETSGQGWVLDQGLYRGWAGAEGDWGTVRFGRQRIAWGTGKLWNPTDVLNPYRFVTVEPNEQVGVDCAYARLALGELTQFEAVYAPQDSFADTAVLDRFHTHVGRVDLSLMAGKVSGGADSGVEGGDFAADLWGGSAHGELASFQPEFGHGFTRWVLGYEYRFSAGQTWSWLDDTWALAEFYRNEAGAANKAQYDFLSILDGQNVSLGRDYLGVGLSKELTPLWTLEAYAIRNLDDDSDFAGPDLKWNALTNVDLIAGVLYFAGPSGSEFAYLHDISYLSAQWTFKL